MEICITKKQDTDKNPVGIFSVLLFKREECIIIYKLIEYFSSNSKIKTIYIEKIKKKI